MRGPTCDNRDQNSLAYHQYMRRTGVENRTLRFYPGVKMIRMWIIPIYMNLGIQQSLIFAGLCTGAKMYINVPAALGMVFVGLINVTVIACVESTARYESAPRAEHT